MSLLATPEKRIDRAPLCNGCRKSIPANPPLHRWGALRTGEPVLDSTRHYPQPVRPPIPHFNSRGEIIKVPSAQVRILKERSLSHVFFEAMFLCARAIFLALRETMAASVYTLFFLA
jgi:hypothetical protein